jgi:hypothetical protein
METKFLWVSSLVVLLAGVDAKASTERSSHPSSVPRARLSQQRLLGRVSPERIRALHQAQLLHLQAALANTVDPADRARLYDQIAQHHLTTALVARTYGGLLQIVNPAHRQVFDLHQQGLDVHQIASQLGRSERGVRTIIRKAEIRIARLRSIATGAGAAALFRHGDQSRREP